MYSKSHWKFSLISDSIGSHHRAGTIHGVNMFTFRMDLNSNVLMAWTRRFVTRAFSYTDSKLDVLFSQSLVRHVDIILGSKLIVRHDHRSLPTVHLSTQRRCTVSKSQHNQSTRRSLWNQPSSCSCSQQDTSSTFPHKSPCQYLWYPSKEPFPSTLCDRQHR